MQRIMRLNLRVVQFVFMVSAFVSLSAFASVKRIALVWNPILTDADLPGRVLSDRLADGLPNPDSVFQIPSELYFESRAAQIWASKVAEKGWSLQSKLEIVVKEIVSSEASELIVAVNASGMEGAFLDPANHKIPHAEFLKLIFGTLDSLKPEIRERLAIRFLVSASGGFGLLKPLEYRLTGRDAIQYRLVELWSAAGVEGSAFPGLMWENLIAYPKFLKAIGDSRTAPSDWPMSAYVFRHFSGINESQVWSSDKSSLDNEEIHFQLADLLNVILGKRRERVEVRAMAANVLADFKVGLPSNVYRLLLSILNTGRMAPGISSPVKLISDRRPPGGKRYPPEARELGAALITALVKLGIQQQLPQQFEQFLRILEWGIWRSEDSRVIAHACDARFSVMGDYGVVETIQVLPRIHSFDHSEFLLQLIAKHGVEAFGTMLSVYSENPILVDTDPRTESAGRLAVMQGKLAVDALAFAYVSDSSVAGRMYKLNVLGAARLPESVPFLIETLNRGIPEETAFAAGALGKIGARARSAVPHLLTLLRNGVDIERQWAAYALGQLGDPKAVSGLSIGTLDRDFLVRYYTVIAIGRLKSKDGIAALERATGDSVDIVRQAAVKALSERWGVHGPVSKK